MIHRTVAVAVVATLVLAVVAGGCGRKKQPVTLQVRFLESSPADSLTEMTMTVWGGHRTFYARPHVILDQRDVGGARVSEEQGRPAVELVFVGDAQKKLFDITRSNIGKRLGIVINGHLITAPVIRAPIESGLLVVSGHISERDAEHIADGLSGKQ